MPMPSPEPSIGSVRRSLLSRLQEEIHGFGRPALIALAGSDHPVMHTIGPDGRRVAVVAMWLGDSWWFVWGRDGQAPADSPRDVAAILAGLRPADGGGAGKVRDLFSRRPRARGKQVAHAASGAFAEVA
ncbi:hypothetical protein LP52_12950 [Streptomonospora alba]|uniref:Uncharacterized protein n=1 Tax=Streptomonospora alba TaxID=183763 RepID=A0A0C2G5E3_9ACTN|nr:hypothetical protein [Streptomonospora alba]KIH98493.1 hypothetical protein LP52_12950 [Streptomonospora alba]